MLSPKKWSMLAIMLVAASTPAITAADDVPQVSAPISISRYRQPGPMQSPLSPEDPRAVRQGGLQARPRLDGRSTQGQEDEVLFVLRESHEEHARRPSTRGP